jgi:hypothetical protein
MVHRGRYLAVLRQLGPSNPADDCGPERLIPLPTFGLLEVHRVDLLRQAIPRLVLSWDRQIRDVLGHRGCPLGGFLSAAIARRPRRQRTAPLTEKLATRL